MKSFIFLLTVLIVNICLSQKTSSDDGLHFGAGALISGTTYALVYSKTKNRKKAFWYSLTLSTLAGLAKEVHDGYIISGRFDTSEFLATAAGGITVSCTFNLLSRKNKKQRSLSL